MFELQQHIKTASDATPALVRQIRRSCTDF